MKPGKGKCACTIRWCIKHLRGRHWFRGIELFKWQHNAIGTRQDDNLNSFYAHLTNEYDRGKIIRRDRKHGNLWAYEYSLPEYADWAR
jgi:hypothetical protein